MDERTTGTLHRVLARAIRRASHEEIDDMLEMKTDDDRIVMQILQSEIDEEIHRRTKENE